MGYLDYKLFFLTVAQVEKSTVIALTGPLSGKGLPGLQMVIPTCQVQLSFSDFFLIGALL